MRTGLLLAAILLAVAGCANRTGQSQLLNAFVPSAPGKNTVITALNDGILDPAVSAGLSSGDRLRALEAEYRALEIASSGQIVAWQGVDGDVSGEVYAAQPYEVGSQNCRQYVHRLTLNGQVTTFRGTACRNTDGSWTPLV